MDSRGYIIHAQNTRGTDYTLCARVLAHSLRRVQPNARITLLTNDSVSDPVFEHIVQLPFTDNQFKMSNDWQVYWATPYERTIKLEADMYIPRSIEHWWSILESRDLCIATTIRDYKNVVSTVDYYRRSIRAAQLVDTYNAITYFRRSDLAHQFFTLVKHIFENWREYAGELGIVDPQASTDVVYAIAATAIGQHLTTMPHQTDISMIHMKSMINGTRARNWTHELICEIDHDHTRINTFATLYPLHYQVKSFAKTLWSKLHEQ